MRVLVDYRPALRERTGVGEYVHQFVRALLKAFSKPDLELALISSSWKDRLAPSSEIAGATIVDRRVPGKLLNLAWHRLGWPPAEMLAGLSVSRLDPQSVADHEYCPAVPIGRLRSRIDWAKVIVGIRLPSPSLFEVQAGAAQIEPDGTHSSCA